MMNLAEKVGRMMMVGFEGLQPPAYILDWLRSGRIGGVYLFARNVQSPAQVQQLVAECRAAAPYPILVGIDQEGGAVARLRDGFSEGPGNMALGAARDPQLAEEVAGMLGRELAALGINWNFAPVADIAHQRDNPSVGTRSVGRDSALVSDIIIAQVRGYQRSGVAATVKHFPGLGNTVIDTHVGLARVSGALDYLYAEDLLPFRRAIADDVACVMLTHVIYDELDAANPATLSRRIVTDLLRGELGFSGAVSTDCMEMKAISEQIGAGESAVRTVLAGVDLPLFSHTVARQEAAYNAVLAAAQSGQIPEARIDESLARIDAMQRRYSLADAPALEIVDCPAHRDTAKRAARAGTALLKAGAALKGLRESRLVALEFATEQVSDAVEASSQRTFLDYLARRLPEANCHVLYPNDHSPLSESLFDCDTVILLTRNAHLQPAQLQRAQAIMRRARRVILVCARNPYDADCLPSADTILCTHGDSRPSLMAAVDALCGDFQPGGKLPVEIG
ncbi:MAG: glycoside hydrolase family 3 protein [Chloroflexi bacterium]|nr:glycoside hydrolase family 3 protein [Chloroflexota bacterium]MYD39463.1 glycoside hydrolase family 3 protein [Chloroflexota bacterium]